MSKDAQVIINLCMIEIFADPTFNCRGSVAPIDVTELARDIEQNGLQQPIIVKPIVDQTERVNSNHNYKIVSGHRRYTAFRVLGRETIPCIINADINDAQALVLNLSENLHRKDLNIVQEANALEKLKLEGFSASEVAELIGKSSTWVNVRYMLLELPELIREAAAAGFITQRHIQELHKIGNLQEQMEAARKIKLAKMRGERPPNLKKATKRNIMKAKIRNKEDVFWMQEHIQDAIGNNFGTRCLAWAAGEINDFELFKDIDNICIKSGIPYSIPYALGGLK